MSLRITAGEFRNSRLFSLPGLATRPMGERARQAVFNLLMDRVSDAGVLDLFAGSGALSLEALSRGAAHAVLVDNSPAALDVIRRNIEKLRLDSRTRVVRLDVFYVDSARLGPFDIIFCDPPYALVRSVTPQSRFGRFLASLHEHHVLKPSGLIVLGHHRESEIASDLGPLHLTDRRNYGINGISFFSAARRDTGGLPVPSEAEGSTRE